MSEPIQFFMPMIPPTVTDQEKRIGRNKQGDYFIYRPQKMVDVRQKLSAYLAKHVPNKKLQGALCLYVKWLFPIKGNHFNGEYKTSKPDTDNLEKTLKDVMTELGFWKDDAQVASEVVEKFWADIPGIFIVVKELQQNRRSE